MMISQRADAPLFAYHIQSLYEASSLDAHVGYWYIKVFSQVESGGVRTLALEVQYTSKTRSTEFGTGGQLRLTATNCLTQQSCFGYVQQ